VLLRCAKQLSICGERAEVNPTAAHHFFKLQKWLIGECVLSRITSVPGDVHRDLRLLIAVPRPILGIRAPPDDT
jgi:hypothetical protein